MTIAELLNQTPRPDFARRQSWRESKVVEFVGTVKTKRGTPRQSPVFHKRRKDTGEPIAVPWTPHPDNLAADDWQPCDRQGNTQFGQEAKGHMEENANPSTPDETSTPPTGEGTDQPTETPTADNGEGKG